MKKYILITLALLILLSLSACGEDKDAKTQNETDTTAQTSATVDTTVAATDDTTLDTEDIEDIDLDYADIFSGFYSDILSELPAAQKQELINMGKLEGVEVTFNSDGSTSFVSEDGSTFVQNKDGTYTMTDSDGNVGQFGGVWPENEYTSLIPKADFGTLLSAGTDTGNFTAMLQNVTVDDVKAYAEKVKSAGFTINPEVIEQSISGMEVYSYMAENSDGYTITVSFSAEYATIIIEKLA